MKRFMLGLLVLCMLVSTAMAEIKTTSAVRLRTGPDTTFRIITTVPKGTVLIDLDSVMYDAQERPWYWVEWEGQDCWVCGDYAIVTVNKEPGAQSVDPLAESRWLSVSILGPDGTAAYPVGYGGSELWLFPDGTAHWQVYNGEGYLSRNPIGHWKKADDGSLVFYQGENFEAAEEGRVQRFAVTDEGLCTCWDNDWIIDLVQYDVLDRWLPLPRDRLLGEWVMYAGETEGWRYMAEEEGVDAAIRFAEAPNGAIAFDYRWNGVVKKGIAQYSINGLSSGSDLTTAWAPWYLSIDLKENERLYAYLLNQTMLRVEKCYFLDGAPAISTQDYIRQDE